MIYSFIVVLGCQHKTVENLIQRKEKKPNNCVAVIDKQHQSEVQKFCSYELDSVNDFLFLTPCLDCKKWRETERNHFSPRPQFFSERGEFWRKENRCSK